MLPFVQERRRELAEKSSAGAAAFLHCGDCRNATPENVRQTWNCGHLPRLPGNRYQGPPLELELAPDTACPGYLIALPAVAEASHAHLWWDKGQLRDYCDGEQPTVVLRTCVEVLAGSIGEAQATAMRLAQEGAKRRA